MSSTFGLTPRADDAILAAAATPATDAPPVAAAGKRTRRSVRFAPLQFDAEMVRLHHQIVALRPNGAYRSILFIGSRDSEGTSTIAHEFARVSATQFGMRVLLLESVGDVPESSAALPHVHTESVPGNGAPLVVAGLPRQLTAASRMADAPGVAAIWERLRQSRDLIVIDAPSATRSPEGLALVSQVDGVVLVVEADCTRWPVAARTIESIVRSGGRVLGVVFNKRRFYIPAFLYNWL